MAKLTPELLVDSKCELGEGPIWDPRCNKLLSLDILHSKIFLFDPVTGVNEMHDLSAHTSSIGTIVPAQGGSTSQVVLGDKRQSLGSARQAPGAGDTKLQFVA